MSFSFNWPRFSEKFHADTKQVLDAALNKGPKPPIIEDRIEVVELEMGTQPPELQIHGIGDLAVDQFRGIFKLSYAGDAYIVLRTKVQANPLHHKKPGMDLLGGSRGILAAQKSLVVPMELRLSNFRLNAYVVLVVSKLKGITLVFKTDPLQNVDVNSTFDPIVVIQKYIQKEIEDQLREMFREDLPGIIHRLSQRWIPGNTKSNHTLSPFTRSVEHFTVRSVPHHRQPLAKLSKTKGSNTPPERQPTKAKRKRTFHLGSSRLSVVTPSSPRSPSPVSFSPSAPSEISEVDHYFSTANSPHPRLRSSLRS
ncbi:uncharacterized protein EI90DRAFT_3279492 [Cantharellus anzutake]|uniref:uncharacterized protein n=1 Tax=Cantharellus anzutake TaxID=1750568 RepID=UPI001905F65D|nr:uncharacterized protein EI90DRAFT_3279492 [Cantharellus anzutake]KAF8339093.1 hypothetical protein EI90DRAFT_3279492 [Cantharellus anzutake]